MVVARNRARPGWPQREPLDNVAGPLCGKRETAWDVARVCLLGYGWVLTHAPPTLAECALVFEHPGWVAYPDT